MDSNNYPANCGVGEREGRVFSNLVSRKTWNLAHGVGRSGDLREPQPKAAGSSILVSLTNSLVVDWLRFNGARSVKEAFVAPVSTGMAMVLCLLALRHKRPHAKYVVWSRIDQKSCFKAIITAGYIPIIVDLVKGTISIGRPQQVGKGMLLSQHKRGGRLANRLSYLYQSMFW